MEKFRDDNQGYLKWLDAPPSGYVLNIGRQPHQGTPPYYEVLHRAKCGSIRRQGDDYTGTYDKVCADDPSVLISYGRKQEGNAPMFCQKCKPMSA